MPNKVFHELLRKGHFWFTSHQTYRPSLVYTGKIPSITEQSGVLRSIKINQSRLGTLPSLTLPIIYISYLRMHRRWRMVFSTGTDIHFCTDHRVAWQCLSRCKIGQPILKRYQNFGRSRLPNP